MSLAGRIEPQAASGISQRASKPRQKTHGTLNPTGATRLVRWLLDPVSDVSAPVHAALIAELDLSASGSAVALVSFNALNAMSFWLTHAPVLLGLLVANVLVSLLRLASLLLVRRGDAATQAWRTDTYVLMTILWCVLEAAMTGRTIASNISVLQVVGVAVALAPQAAFATRNFPAPRFAMAIILGLNVPCSIWILFGPNHWLIALSVLSPGYLFGTIATIKRFQNLLIENYVAQFANKWQASHDPLTGILNRRGMNEALEIGAGRHFTLFAMDLDGFKKVNDTHGHAAGDLLLKMVTARLHEVARKEDSLARLGGDEFVLIAPGLSAGGAEAVAARIVAAVSAPEYHLDGTVTARIGVSVGFACAPEDGATLQGLCELADSALYAVKQRGKGSWQRTSRAEVLSTSK
jgi:diguanylate cyclase (GGDEF)-like protein